MDETDEKRLSSLDGFTIVWRRRKRPRVHLFRPYESCNTDDANDKQKVKGSRESLNEVLGAKPAAACLRCFPGPSQEEREQIMASVASASDLEIDDSQYMISEESKPEGYTEARSEQEAEG